MQFAVTLSAFDLQSEISEITASTQSLGVQLGFSLDELKAMEKECMKSQHTIEERMELMLAKWKDLGTNRTWNDIYKALEKLGNKRLVRNLKTGSSTSEGQFACAYTNTVCKAR